MLELVSSSNFIRSSDPIANLATIFIGIHRIGGAIVAAMPTWASKLYRQMGNTSSQPSPRELAKQRINLDPLERATRSPSQRPVAQDAQHKKRKRPLQDTNVNGEATQEIPNTQMVENGEQGPRMKGDPSKSRRPKARKTGHMRPPFPSPQPNLPSSSQLQLDPAASRPAEIWSMPSPHRPTSPPRESKDLRPADDSRMDVDADSIKIQARVALSDSSAVAKQSAVPEQVEPRRKRKKDRMTLDTDEEAERAKPRPKTSSSQSNDTKDAWMTRVDLARCEDSPGPEPAQDDEVHRNHHLKQPRSEKENKKKKGSSTKKQQTLVYSLGNGPSKGRFNDEEIQLADAIFESRRKEERKTDVEMRASIEDWTSVVDFKVELEAALPNRTKTAIRRFCKRHFSTRHSGEWSKEEDRDLLEAYKRYPDAWHEIGDVVNRGADNCRSRYKNHLQMGDKKQTGPWSHDEETRFVASVDECLEAIRGKIGSDGDKADDMINFGVVSQKIRNRSHQRCRAKWQQLRARGALEFDDEGHVSLTAHDSVPVERAHEESKNSRRLAERIDTLKDGDFHDLLTEIHTTFPDHAEQWRNETTVWAKIARANPKSAFALAGLRPAAYRAARDKFDPKGKIGKKKTIAATAALLALAIEKAADRDGTPMSRAHPKPSRSEGSVSSSRSRRRVKTPEMVGDSDASAWEENSPLSRKDVEHAGHDEIGEDNEDEEQSQQDETDVPGFIKQEDEESIDDRDVLQHHGVSPITPRSIKVSGSDGVQQDDESDSESSQSSDDDSDDSHDSHDSEEDSESN